MNQLEQILGVCSESRLYAGSKHNGASGRERDHMFIAPSEKRHRTWQPPGSILTSCTAAGYERNSPSWKIRVTLPVDVGFLQERSTAASWTTRWRSSWVERRSEAEDSNLARKHEWSLAQMLRSLTTLERFLQVWSTIMTSKVYWLTTHLPES